ncbi:MAG TPA: MFS transporter [Mycobacteriales bacterium]|nr:MFS transporter [Mycobacteriales bacterium]
MRPAGRMKLAPRELTSAREVLAEPNFARLFATRLTAQTADGVFNVALAGFALFSPERQTSPGEVAGAFAALLLPYSVVGPFAGVLIDRWSRQRILVVANLVRALLVLGVIAIVVSDVATPVFYASALLVLSVNRFLLSALSAALPHVVQRPRLVLANALSTTSGTLVAIVGGGVGYALRAAFGSDDAGIAAIMAVAAAGYVVSAAVAAPMDRALLGPDVAVEPRPVTEAFHHVLRGVAQGAAHVWSRRRAGHALLAIGAHRFFYGLSFIATLLLYNEDFGLFREAGLLGLGRVFAASGLGYLIAAVVTPRMARRLGVERWIAVLFGAAALAEVLFGTPYTQPTFLAAAFALGVVAQGSKICVDSIVQSTIEDDFRGRVFSFYDILFNISFVSAAAVAALTLPRDGKSYPVLALIALGYAATAVLYALATRRSSAALDSASGPAEPRPARRA